MNHSELESLSMTDAATRIDPPKDGAGIGDLVDEETLDVWATDYMPGAVAGTNQGNAFRFGVRAETRYAGLSFFEAEAELRSDWSSEKGRPPWVLVRESVWAGFDRARDRHV